MYPCNISEFPKPLIEQNFLLDSFHSYKLQSFNMILNLATILLSPDLGPYIISMLPLDKKRHVLRAMGQHYLELANSCVHLLWSNPWSLCISRHDRNTGLYQEFSPLLGGWPGDICLNFNTI